MFNRLLICCLLGLVFFPGCRNDPENQKGRKTLFADLFVRYFEEDQSLKAQAVFFEGQTLDGAAPFEPAGGVSFQGSAMEKKEIPGAVIRYEINRKLPYSDRFPFRFQTKSGQWQEANMSMSPLAGYLIAGDKGSKTGGVTIIIKGAVLNEIESLVVILTDKNRKSAAHEITGPVAANEVLVPANALTGLEPGRCSVYLVKKRHEVLEKEGLTVFADQEYYSDAKDFELMP